MQPDTFTTESRGVSFVECCRRLGISARTGRELLRRRRFPIPPLPDELSTGSKRPRRLYSTFDIELYLREAASYTERERTQRARLRAVR